MEIPQYLQPSLKSLEALSYALKKKFPRIRRNIKFDDEKLDLVLDFHTDPGADSPQWKKIRPSEASLVRGGAAGRDRLEELSGADVGRLLEDDDMSP